MSHEVIIVLDFGGQYNQLIARRIRDSKVYCEVYPYYELSIEDIKSKNPKGIILTGGSTFDQDDILPIIDKQIFELGIPILGICYGCQLLVRLKGGKIKFVDEKEYGKSEINYDKSSILFKNVWQTSSCWMNHNYKILELPKNFEIIASTPKCDNAAISDDSNRLYGVQFHPEVVHTPDGEKIINNFLYDICHCNGDWHMSNFAKEKINHLKKQIGDKKGLCALSGGVDSTVAAVMVHKAIGKNLTCIFVDHGLMRLNEGDEVMRMCKDELDMNIIRVNAEERFLKKLHGITDPETKRKVIGEEFIRIFEEEGKEIGSIDFLVQGTIYPDIIESGTKTSSVIKSHHNVGGLPDVIDFKEIIEPLKDLFKDEVRNAGKALGIPNNLVNRQPFPGPGLAIRIIGEVTKEKLNILRMTDYIFRDEIVKAQLDREIWQYFTIMTGIRSVGVLNDKRTYSYTIALRAVNSIDAMSADWVKIPYEVLEKVSSRIVNEISEVNRVVYDITSKPPSTIEWE